MRGIAGICEGVGSATEEASSNRSHEDTTPSILSTSDHRPIKDLTAKQSCSTNQLLFSAAAKKPLPLEAVAYCRTPAERPKFEDFDQILKTARDNHLDSAITGENPVWAPSL